MKSLTTNITGLFLLGLFAMQASADNRNELRHGFDNAAGIHWRLGNYRGGNGGYEILFQPSGRGRWQRAPGEAMAIGDGWVLGTDRHNGGYGIYRWNGYDWNRMPGAAVRIGGSYRQPWVENDRGIRYVWNGYDWMQNRSFAGNDRNRGRDYREDGRQDQRNNFRDSERRGPGNYDDRDGRDRGRR